MFINEAKYNHTNLVKAQNESNNFVKLKSTLENRINNKLIIIFSTTNVKLLLN